METICNYAVNNAEVTGVVEENLVLSHKTSWESFYKTRVKAVRLSGTADYVPILISQVLMPKIPEEDIKGRFVTVKGTVRSYSVRDEDGNGHLEFFLFVSEIEFHSDEDSVKNMNRNFAHLEGYICKKPAYRVTPFGRDVTDVMLAVNMNFKKSYYIPCIVWGKTAQFVSKLNVGDKLRVEGRIQSREYYKKYPAGSEIDGETKTAYEISVSRLKRLESEE